MRQPQCAQLGASAWIAHSKLSNVCLPWPMVISIVLSQSLPHTSQIPIATPLRLKRAAAPGFGRGRTFMEMPREPVDREWGDAVERAGLD
jgi:hypothetical protein